MKLSLLPMSVFAVLLGACGSVGDDTAQSTEDLSAPSCAPSIADGAVTPAHRAMLDTIAFTEGTAGSCGQDGYNTGFAFNCFTSCGGHPHIAWNSGGFASTAAGRYQFLDFTWDEFGYPSFSFKYQDIGAIRLIEDKRQVFLPEDRPLTATEFANAMSKLSYEWASLPPYRYPGQGQHSSAEVRAKYCSFAGCDGQAGRSDAGTLPPADSCSVGADQRLTCGNAANTPIYDSPGFTTVVDTLRTKTSWFDCFSFGAKHGGGNNTWYHTTGDDHGRQGWVPAQKVKTSADLDADPSAKGLPACE